MRATDRYVKYNLLMRSLGLDKLSNTQQIFQLEIFQFFAVKRPNQPLRYSFHTQNLQISFNLMIIPTTFINLFQDQHSWGLQQGLEPPLFSGKKGRVSERIVILSTCEVDFFSAREMILRAVLRDGTAGRLVSAKIYSHT